MKKTIAILMVLMVSSFLVMGARPTELPVQVPSHAKQIYENVYSLGQGVDSDGRIVDGIMIVHKKGQAKPENPGKGNGKDKDGGDSASTCYGFLANGAGWKVSESWVMNPFNTGNISGNFLLSNMEGNIQKWEAAASANIMGSGTLTSQALSVDTNGPDGQNEVYFGTADDPNTIAYTTIWGVFKGNPRNRQIVEWDMVFNQADFSWSASGEPDKMDFENIATHELGHAIGLGHPSSDCTEETMYSYATEGETKKRTLEAGDIAGAKDLY